MIQHNYSSISSINSHFSDLHDPVYVIPWRYIHMQIQKKIIITYLSRKLIILCYNEYSFMRYYICNNYTFNGGQLSGPLRSCIIYRTQHFNWIDLLLVNYVVGSFHFHNSLLIYYCFVRFWQIVMTISTLRGCWFTEYRKVQLNHSNNIAVILCIWLFSTQ